MVLLPPRSAVFRQNSGEIIVDGALGAGTRLGLAHGGETWAIGEDGGKPAGVGWSQAWDQRDVIRRNERPNPI